MASTIVATVGASNANAYDTVANATTYFGDRLDADTWTKAGATKQAQALMQATRRIDAEDFVGVPVNPATGTSSGTTQALKWPRYGAIDHDGHVFLHTVVPEPIKEAMYELALAMLKGDILSDTGLEGFKEVEVGSIRAVPRHRRADALPAVVRRLLAPYLLGGSGLNVRVDRG